MPLEQCLRAYTADAAFAEFAEMEKGTLEPGKLADLVVPDRDIFASDTAALDATEVTVTVVGGQVAYRRRARPRSRTPQPQVHRLDVYLPVVVASRER